MQKDTNRHEPVALRNGYSSHAKAVATGVLAFAFALAGCGGGSEVDLDLPSQTSVEPLALPGRTRSRAATSPRTLRAFRLAARKLRRIGKDAQRQTARRAICPTCSRIR